MSNHVATLAGDPPGWPAALRDLLRVAGEGSLDRAALLEALSEEDATDADAADRRLAFLESARIVDCTEEGCTPAAYGREYLDTHDESVLFEALLEATDGVGDAVKALSVRPLTDVEVADLLSRTLETDVDAATAGRYLAWLQALGYLDRADGVNELTRKGRRLVATREDLAPPGAGGADQPPVGLQAGDAPSMMTPEVASIDRGADRDLVGGGSVDRAAGDGPAADGSTADAAGTVDEPPGDEPSRDEGPDRDLRDRYDDVCMVCGERRQRGPEAGYAEVHYLMPPGPPHDGPVAPENAVVVCPNHRADLEHGAVTIDPRTLAVDHDYESAVAGRTLRTEHDLGAQYLAYHNDVIAGD